MHLEVFAISQSNASLLSFSSNDLVSMPKLSIKQSSKDVGVVEGPMLCSDVGVAEGGADRPKLGSDVGWREGDLENVVEGDADCLKLGSDVGWREGDLENVVEGGADCLKLGSGVGWREGDSEETVEGGADCLKLGSGVGCWEGDSEETVEGGADCLKLGSGVGCWEGDLEETVEGGADCLKLGSDVGWREGDLVVREGDTDGLMLESNVGVDEGGFKGESELSCVGSKDGGVDLVGTVVCKLLGIGCRLWLGTTLPLPINGSFTFGRGLYPSLSFKNWDLVLEDTSSMATPLALAKSVDTGVLVGWNFMLLFSDLNLANLLDLTIFPFFGALPLLDRTRFIGDGEAGLG